MTTLFTKEFLDDLIFLIENIHAEREFEESYEATPTFDDPLGYKCDGEWERAAEYFELTFPDIKRQINNYYNIDFDQLLDFLHENQNTQHCDVEAKFKEYMKEYMEYYMS